MGECTPDLCPPCTIVVFEAWPGQELRGQHLCMSVCWILAVSREEVGRPWGPTVCVSEFCDVVFVAEVSGFAVASVFTESSCRVTSMPGGFSAWPRLLNGRETMKSYPNSHFCFQSNDNQFLLELIGGPLKTRNMSACVQEGRIFAENETWVVDSCTTCTCKVSSTDKFSCRQKCPAQGRHVQINTCRS